MRTQLSRGARELFLTATSLGARVLAAWNLQATVWLPARSPVESPIRERGVRPVTPFGPERSAVCGDG